MWAVNFFRRRKISFSLGIKPKYKPRNSVKDITLKPIILRQVARVWGKVYSWGLKAQAKSLVQISQILWEGGQGLTSGGCSRNRDRPNPVPFRTVRNICIHPFQKMVCVPMCIMQYFFFFKLNSILQEIRRISVSVGSGTGECENSGSGKKIRICPDAQHWSELYTPRLLYVQLKTRYSSIQGSIQWEGISADVIWGQKYEKEKRKRGKMWHRGKKKRK